ncbi:MAG: type II toxin-antitoxin system VapC family toxin [Puniceicoccaceae bacterium]|nr:MAG: type II toxin-antitoxin system VapC family toxin [Puniceicoccaceae bacterium]
MEALIFDTTFLIDFQRERSSGKGRAHRFLKNREGHGAKISAISFGEFAEGFENPNDPILLSVADSYEILPINVAVAKTYARIIRALRLDGNLIGANDLWIAATALLHENPIVTRNVEHFARVPGIQVQSY